MRNTGVARAQRRISRIYMLTLLSGLALIVGLCILAVK